LLIKAFSLGITEKEFWSMTPFKFYLRSRGFEEKVRLESAVNLLLVNTVRSLGKNNAPIQFEELLGVMTLKDMNFKTRKHFFKDGKTDWEGWHNYVKTVINPWKEGR